MLHENLIPKKYLQELQECFNYHCEWHFSHNTTYGPSESHLDEGKLGSLGFTMMFFEQERWVPSVPATLVRPLISYIHEKVEEECGEPVSLFRARADMTLYNPENHRHEVHTDFKFPHITAIFYLINSDGNTLLMDKDGNVEEEFEPVENRLITFEGETPHTGHSPSKHKNRILFNVNFVREDPTRPDNLPQ
jgi:hypothetical protein